MVTVNQYGDTLLNIRDEKEVMSAYYMPTTYLHTTTYYYYILPLHTTYLMQFRQMLNRCLHQVLPL